MSYQITFSPTTDELLELKGWLIQEYEQTGEGFFSNWKVIENYFNKEQLIFLLSESRVIGFTTWDLEDDIAVNIDIAAVHPEYRFKGAGKKMMEESFKHFVSQGIVVAKLFCEPRSSEKFWRRLGFLSMPVLPYYQHEISLYCPLVNTYEIANKIDEQENDIIELWDCEPYQVSENSPKWTWNIELNDNQLNKPILIPCNRDWYIKWTRNGEVIKDGKVKYFSQNNPVDRSSFLYIHKLK